MISLTRLNGERIALNPDLIERVETTPDSVLTLTNGTKYVISESLDELVEKIQYFRAAILAISRQMSEDPDANARFRLHLVRDPAEPASERGASERAGSERTGSEGGVSEASAGERDSAASGGESAASKEKSSRVEPGEGTHYDHPSFAR